MKKEFVSQPIKKWLKICILLSLLSYLLYLISKFSIFLFFSIGLCVGVIYRSISVFVKEQLKEQRIRKAVQKMKADFDYDQWCHEKELEFESIDSEK